MNYKTLLSVFLILILNNYCFAQKFDAEVLTYKSLCVIDKDKLTRTDSISIQINNRNGDKYAEVNIPYSKLEKISNIEAWITNPDGTIARNLKKSEIRDKSAISEIALYEDDFTKYFELKHNTYPYKITYTYQITYKDYITINFWTPILHPEIPTLQAKLKTTLPKGYKFSSYQTYINQFKKDSTDTQLNLVWEASYLNPTKSEIYSQPENLWPRVIVMPRNFKYGINGSSNDWISYGNWQFNLMEGLDILPPEEKKTVSELINGITDRKEIVRILYHYLQNNTRYINISIGIGGLKPYPASYVAINKYGDCKALTNYMKSLLLYAGIESFYTKVYASTQPKNIIESLPGPQFNHVILAVPLQNDTIWLENTNNSNPFGYVGTFTQNRKALLVAKDRSKLVNTPALKLKDNQSSFHIQFILNTHGMTKAILKACYRGFDFEQFNQVNEDYNDDEKDKIIRNFLSFGNYDIENWKLNKTNRDSAGINLIANLNTERILRPLGKEYYFTLFPCRIPLFTSPENRQLPVEIPYPISQKDTLIYDIPLGYEVKNSSDTITLTTNYGKYVLNFSKSKNQFIAIREFDLYQANYTLQQYPEFYSFIKLVLDTDKKKITIKPN